MEKTIFGVTQFQIQKNFEIKKKSKCGNESVIRRRFWKKYVDGATPLHLAAGQGKIEVFIYLTEIGFDYIREVYTSTAFHDVAHSVSVEIIKILLDKGMSCN